MVFYVECLSVNNWVTIFKILSQADTSYYYNLIGNDYLSYFYES